MNGIPAIGINLPEDMVHGRDRNSEFIISSHPTVLVGFINVFRREVLAREKEADISIQKEPQEMETDTLGQAVSKWETAASTPDIVLLPDIAFFSASRLMSCFIFPMRQGMNASKICFDMKGASTRIHGRPERLKSFLQTA